MMLTSNRGGRSAAVSHAAAGRSYLAAVAMASVTVMAVDQTHAAALYTTLHSATYSANWTGAVFVGNSGTLSGLAYNGPATNSLTDVQALSGFYSSNDPNNASGYTAGFTIVGNRFSMYSFQNMDAVGFELDIPSVSGAWSTHVTTLEWDVSFSTAVVLDSKFHNSNPDPVDLTNQVWTVTDSSSNTISASFGANGTVLQAGRYTIKLIGTRNGTAQWDDGVFLVRSLAAPVPGSGLAAVGSLGLAGLARRRRR